MIYLHNQFNIQEKHKMQSLFIFKSQSYTNISYKRRARTKEEAAPTWKEFRNVIVEAEDVELRERDPLYFTRFLLTTARFLEPCSSAEHKRRVWEKKMRNMIERRITRLALISPISSFCLLTCLISDKCNL